MDDCRLVISSPQSSNSGIVYGSEEDESDARNFLSCVNKNDTQLKEIVISHFKEKFENLSEVYIQIYIMRACFLDFSVHNQEVI